MKNKNRENKTAIHVDYIDTATHSIFPQYDSSPKSKSDVQDPVLDDPSNRSQLDNGSIPRYQDYVAERQAELIEESAHEDDLDDLSDDEFEEYRNYILKRVGAGALIGLVLAAGAIGARNYAETRAETSTSGPAVPGSNEQGSGSVSGNYVTDISDAEHRQLTEDARERSLEQLDTIKENANNTQISTGKHTYRRTSPSGTSTLDITREKSKDGRQTIRVVTKLTTPKGTETTYTVFETENSTGDPVDALSESDTELVAYGKEETSSSGTKNTSIVFTGDNAHIVTKSTGKNQKHSTNDIINNIGKSNPEWAR